MAPRKLRVQHHIKQALVDDRLPLRSAMSASRRLHRGLAPYLLAGSYASDVSGRVGFDLAGKLAEDQFL